MSIFLIRHGETEGNAKQVVQHPETPLSEAGIDQARRLARRLAEADVVRILSSDMARAAMTAEALRATTEAPLELEPLLQERNFGDYRGTPYSQLEVDLFGPQLEPPGGESWGVFHERVAGAWERVVAAEQSCAGNLAVVTHGLVLHSILAQHVTLPDEMARPPRDGPPMRFGNTALTVVSRRGDFTVVRLACTDHLDGEALSGGAV